MHIYDVFARVRQTRAALRNRKNQYYHRGFAGRAPHLHRAAQHRSGQKSRCSFSLTVLLESYKFVNR